MSVVNPTGPFYPTNVLVGIAWLEQNVPEFVGKNIVGPTLPKSFDGLRITVSDDRGGSALVDIPLRRPLLRVTCWAATAGSNVPPLKLAAYGAECIRNATERDDAPYGREVTMPNGYLGARVQAAFLPEGTEPRSVLNDPSGYARVDVDLEVDWLRMPLPAVIQ